MDNHRPIHILLQTTIAPAEDDWHIGRFSALRHHLEQYADNEGRRLFQVSARDRTAADAPDPVLSTLDESDVDELWLFAVDTGDGLTGADCEGIARFRKRGGGLLVARDHMDLGCSVVTLAGVGAANYFHNHHPDPDPTRRQVDDIATPMIQWPNYHSGANGDFQTIEAEHPAHPVLTDPEAADGVIRFLPSHPHEGGIGAPADDASARVIATGKSQVTGNRFNLAVVFEPADEYGPAIAQSTFHHFADLNWDPALGCPSFVTEPPGNRMAQSPQAQRAVRRYVVNLAHWLAGKTVPAA